MKIANAATIGGNPYLDVTNGVIAVSALPEAAAATVGKTYLVTATGHLWRGTESSGTYAFTDITPAGGSTTVVDPAIDAESQNPVANSAIAAALDGKADLTAGKVPAVQIPDLSSTYVAASGANAANGYAKLDAQGKVPTSLLPSYVSDVFEGYLVGGKFHETNSSSGTEIEAKANAIYVDKTTNKTYRWSGSQYTEISASVALGRTAQTAFPGDAGSALETSVANLSVAVDGKQVAGNYATLTDGKVPAAQIPDLSATYAEKSHTHAQSEVTGLADALDGKANASHTHAKSQITDFSHTHAISEVTGLQSALDGKQASLPSGTAGQYLQKTASGVQWADAATGGDYLVTDSLANAARNQPVFFLAHSVESVPGPAEWGLCNRQYFLYSGESQQVGWTTDTNKLERGHAYVHSQIANAAFDPIAPIDWVTDRRDPDAEAKAYANPGTWYECYYYATSSGSTFLSKSVCYTEAYSWVDIKYNGVTERYKLTRNGTTGFDNNVVPASEIIMATGTVNHYGEAGYNTFELVMSELPSTVTPPPYYMQSHWTGQFWNGSDWDSVMTEPLVQNDSWISLESAIAEIGGEIVDRGSQDGGYEYQSVEQHAGQVIDAMYIDITPASNTAALTTALAALESRVAALEAGGSTPTTGTLTVTYSGTAPSGAQWSADSGTTWNAFGASLALAAGSYTVSYKAVSGYVTPTSQSATVSAGSTTTITANSYIQYGTLLVNYTGTAPSGAQWTHDGGTTWTNFGSSVSVAPGAYTITYKTVSGYTSPASDSATVTSGNTTTIAAGSYTETASTFGLIVYYESGQTAPSGAAWSVDGGSSWNAFDSSLNLSPGSYTITYKAVTGYTAPASHSFTAEAGDSVTFTKAYTAESTSYPNAFTVTGADTSSSTSTAAKAAVNGTYVQQSQTTTYDDSTYPVYYNGYYYLYISGYDGECVINTDVYPMPGASGHLHKVASLTSASLSGAWSGASYTPGVTLTFVDSAATTPEYGTLVYDPVDTTQPFLSVANSSTTTYNGDYYLYSGTASATGVAGSIWKHETLNYFISYYSSGSSIGWGIYDSLAKAQAPNADYGYYTALIAASTSGGDATTDFNGGAGYDGYTTTYNANSGSSGGTPYVEVVNNSDSTYAGNYYLYSGSADATDARFKHATQEYYLGRTGQSNSWAIRDNAGETGNLFVTLSDYDPDPAPTCFYNGYSYNNDYYVTYHAS